jgi:hypothetical protein
MRAVRRFASWVINELTTSNSLRIRAGSQPHRFIGIWVVVVRRRVFVRSWELRSNGWFRTLRREPIGEIQVRTRLVGIRARLIRGETVLRAVDAAYAAKYATPGARQYVQGFRRGRRRASATELLPRSNGFSKQPI